ncbi:MAG: signal peptidase I [Alphaproteobacteria bacterium]|nr:signal peptidase I [Alphaproteobacteria bacterium]
MRRLAVIAIALALWAAAAWTFDLRQVTGAEMSPSLQPGDWVLIGPGAPAAGDVVRLEDPREPGRVVLRRVLALAGAEVGSGGGFLRIDGERTRLREMGRDDTHVVLSEANLWLIRHRVRPLRDPDRQVTVPEGQVWLMADDRDLGVDSRWWGPVPAAQLDGRVWLRAGSSDLWRGRLSPWGRDGPWLPPSKQPR